MTKKKMIDAAHQDFLTWSDEALQLLQRTIDARQNYGGKSKLTELGKNHARLQFEREKLESMELRVVIVAPMSSGKSTIINAIVARQVLPRRNTAMTVFPTVIRLSDHTSIPTLRLLPEFSSLLEKARNPLVQQFDVRRVRESIPADNPELVDVFERAQKGPIGAKEIVEGTEAVCKALGDINDLGRIATTLIPKYSPIGGFRPELTPTIDVSRPGEVQIGGPDARKGMLVIVDTPGPNEDHAGNLYDVLDEELARGTMVLLVLDYTQLNTSAAGDIKARVEKVLELAGRENLLILVNKVDQRKAVDDLSKKAVKEFVRAHLDLGDLNLDSRLFEVAAIWALAAARVRTLIKTLWKEEVDFESEALHELLKLRFPADWEDEIEDLKSMTHENALLSIETSCSRLWKRSGYSKFLDNAVSVLVETAGEEILLSTARIAMNSMSGAEEILKLQLAGHKASVQSLKRAVADLEAEREGIRETRRQIDEESRETIERVRMRVKSLRSGWSSQLAEHVRSKFAIVKNKNKRKGLGGFLKSLGNIKFSADEAEFKSKSEADRVARDISNFARELVVDSVKKKGDDFRKDELETLHAEIDEKLRERVEPALRRARKQLQESFDVNLDIPTFQVDAIKVDVSYSPAKKQESYTVRNTKTRKKKVWYNAWGKLPWGEEDYVETQTRKRTIYVVKLGTLRERAVSVLNDALDQLEDALVTYLETEVKELVDEFVQQVDDVFERYSGSLEAALRDKSKDAETQAAIEKRLKIDIERARELRQRFKGHARELQRN